ncbi:MAG: hypothetical protein C0597_14875 [Marinilabiliales bacterium]|nr:MAG: hypothetical protein C0597_14875 [Marinilabiliales bacterium]
MENNEKNQVAPKNGTELIIDTQTKQNLDETRKWTMFFAILGFIGIGFMVLAALILLIIGIFGSSYWNNREAVMFGGLSALYLVLGAIYFLPILYLLKFSTNMKNAIEKAEQSKLTSAFDYLKSHYKFVGILTIILFAVYILAAVVIGIVGLSSFL